jgi:hypothetical protein
VQAACPSTHAHAPVRAREIGDTVRDCGVRTWPEPPHLIGYVVCLGLAIMAAIFVLASSSWDTLLAGGALMVFVIGVSALARKRTG